MEAINETTKLYQQQISPGETRLYDNPPPYTPYQETPSAPEERFRDISRGCGYIQPIPPPSSVTNTTTVVVNQPQSSNVLIVNPAPYSNMVPAVLTCLFCCWIIGIGAIIASAMVSITRYRNSQSQSAEMRYEEARNSAKISKILTVITFIIGVAFYITVIVVSSTPRR